jgi:hypothetical protein
MISSEVSLIQSKFASNHYFRSCVIKLSQWYARAASNCAPAFTPKEWPERAAPGVQRSWTRALLFMRSRAPAGISTQTLSREEDGTAAGSSRCRCERRPGALAAWENDKRKWYTSLEDTQALMTTKFPFIVLAWCVRRLCPAPTPERAHILMAVGNSKIVHVFSP